VIGATVAVVQERRHDCPETVTGVVVVGVVADEVADGVDGAVEEEEEEVVVRCVAIAATAEEPGAEATIRPSPVAPRVATTPTATVSRSSGGIVVAAELLIHLVSFPGVSPRESWGGRAAGTAQAIAHARPLSHLHVG
jgi:hypothetical protein